MTLAIAMIAVGIGMVGIVAGWWARRLYDALADDGIAPFERRR